jgi:hypothetical protein
MTNEGEFGITRRDPKKGPRMGLFEKLFGKSDLKPSAPAIRDSLYGDQPLQAWPGIDVRAELFPWTAFITARQHVEAGEIDLA